MRRNRKQKLASLMELETFIDTAIPCEFLWKWEQDFAKLRQR